MTEALLFGMWVLSQSLAFAPNFSEAKISAARLFDVLHRSPKLKEGTVVKAGDWKTDGRVKFSQASKFIFP